MALLKTDGWEERERSSAGGIEDIPTVLSGNQGDP